MSKNLYQLMCELSARFFELNRKKPVSMDEIPDSHNFSEAEKHFARKYSELWDAMEWLGRQHKATYEPCNLPTITPALRLTDPLKSGVDYAMDEPGYCAWIETPNGLISIFVDEESSSTTVRMYKSKDYDEQPRFKAILGTPTPIKEEE